jgi:group I intron endonuclease
MAILPFVVTEPGKIYQIRFIGWPFIQRFKKHKALDHCSDVPNNLTAFRGKWKRVSGIYKITFLPFRIFTYYGSSSDMGMRFKYHYFNGPKQTNFLGLFLQVFGWNNFSITVVEVCRREDLFTRENWYLARYQPLLNVLMKAGMQSTSSGLSLLTRAKISAALTGRIDSERTRAKKSKIQIGALNPFFGKGPGIKALDKAAEMAGTKVYAYYADTFTLVNNKPFRSLRSTSKSLPISDNTLTKKIDTGKPWLLLLFSTTNKIRIAITINSSRRRFKISS